MIADKAMAFRSLHQRSDAFVIPNPWDVGTAKLLEQLGYEALATTSAGLAFSLGRPDGAGAVSRDEAWATHGPSWLLQVLPVSADLENGFGDDPGLRRDHPAGRGRRLGGSIHRGRHRAGR